MKTKKPVAEIIYNGHNVTADFSPYVMSVTYSDFEKDQSDELEIVLKDNKDLFKGDWFVEKGTKLSCNMGFNTQPRRLKCGTFTVDTVGLSSDESGDVFTVKALATGHDKAVRTVQTKAHNDKTLVQIAQEIGKKHGFKVAKEDGNIAVGHQVQAKETDIGFLRRIANIFGYSFKITNNLLVFIPIDGLKAKDSLFTLSKKDIKSLTIENTNTKQYCKCSVRYYDPKTKKLKTYTASSSGVAASGDILKINTRCNSLESAKLMAKQGLKNGSKAVKGNISLKEVHFNFIAGVNFNLVGYGRFDGKYHVTEATHSIDENGWMASGGIEKC